MQNARRLRTDRERKRKGEWGELGIHWRLSVQGSAGCHTGAKWRCVTRRVAIDLLKEEAPKNPGSYCTQESRQTNTDHLSFHKSFFPLREPPTLSPQLHSQWRKQPLQTPPTPTPELARVHWPFWAALAPHILSSPCLLSSLPPLLLESGLHANKRSIKPPPDTPINSATRLPHKVKK